MGRFLPGGGGSLSARSHSTAMVNREPLPMGVVEGDDFQATRTASVSSTVEGSSTLADRRRVQSARARPGSGPHRGMAHGGGGGGVSSHPLPMRRALSNLLGPQFGAAVRSRTVVDEG